MQKRNNKNASGFNTDMVPAFFSDPKIHFIIPVIAAIYV
jgi:hypothetical protein